MNTSGGPSPNYLAMINQTLGGAPPQGPMMLGQPIPQPGPLADPLPPPALAGPPPPPVATPEPGPPPGGPNMSVMPPPAPNASQGPPPPPAPAGPGPSAPFLQRIASGVQNVKAKSTELRGPDLLDAQQNRNAAFEGAIQAVTERSQQTAAGDFALALEQQRKAQVHEDAANYSVAERGQEMEQRQADFDQSVRALSQQSVDPDRFWANAGVGRKIAVLLSAGAAGFVQGRTGNVGGGNLGVETAMKLADQDIKAQEFSYNAARDTVNAKQTAFGMAMQKYQNVDAARAAARAAAMDTIQAQLGQQAALWKGTDAANRAQMAIASLQDEKMQQVAQGILFTPARQVATGGDFVDPRTGIHYTNKEAQGVVKEVDERHAKSEEQDKGIAGQLLVEGAKAGAKDKDKTDEGARFIAEKLQTAGVPQARVAAEQALAALNKNPGGKLEAIDRAVVGDTIGNTVHSHEANAREQAYNNFKNAAMKAIFGNVTASEEARAEKQFGAANDPTSRKRAIQSALDMLEGIEKGIRAGTSPAVQSEYSKRRAEAEGAPPAAPKGAAAGWSK